MKYELLNPQNRFQNLFESAPVGIFQSSIEGQLLHANPKLATLFGYDSAAAMVADGGDLGNRFYANPNVRLAVIRKVLALEENHYHEQELELRHRDGSSLFGLLRMRAVRNEQGEVMHFEGFIEDITERKRAEAILRENESLFRIAGRTARFGGWRVNLADEQVVWSEEVAMIHEMEPGYSPSLKAAIQFYAPEWQGKIQEAFRACALAGTPYDKEMEIITGRGHRVWVRVTGEAIRNDAGHIIQVQGSFQDITDRKLAESKKAEQDTQHWKRQKTESLSRMAGAIAHNFNNQLQVVMGNLGLAIEDLPEESRAAEFVVAAMRASRKAAEFSSLMLTYLGQNLGKKHESLDLAEICRRSLPDLWTAMPKNVVLNTDLPTPGPTIEANAPQIQQVLSSLTTNAWEAFGGRPGEIQLTVKIVSPAQIPAASRFPPNWRPHDQAYACLEVKDGGCGIPEKDFEMLFDPFFTTKFTGRGLGLCVVLGVVRAHDGVVTLESKLDRGSVVRVFIPVSAETVNRKPPQMPGTTTVKFGGKMLLVEDEDFVRYATKALLNRLGFSVLEAKDGLEALELFRQNQESIQWVLCDVSMPRMDGWETLTALRRLAPSLPVMLASGFDQAQVMAGEHSELPQVFLQKPFESEKLKEAIRQMLGIEPARV